MTARHKRTLAAALFLGLLPGAQAPQAQSPRPCPGDTAQNTPTARLGADGPQVLLDESFPDPFVARFGTTYHAYATGVPVAGTQLNVQRMQSRNLTAWSAPAEALPHANLPAWVDRNHAQVWAPEVMEIGGRYVLYFNARHKGLTRTERDGNGLTVRQRHCLGTAIADRPEGPFTGLDAPLVCAGFDAGVIDAHPYRDGDNLYVYYKDDGNCCDRESALVVQGLTPDGLATLGEPQRLLVNSDSPGNQDDWEWEVVEAPTMVRRGNAYFLFYSGNFFGNTNYSVGYLRCLTPRGPCTDPGQNPILWSHPGSPLIGPGHQALLEENGRTSIFFHAWNQDPNAREQAGVHKRCLYVSRVHWGRGANGEEVPRIAGGAPPGGTRSTQP